jgi:hypothetical protein
MLSVFVRQHSDPVQWIEHSSRKAVSKAPSSLALFERLGCVEFRVEDLREHASRCNWANALRESIIWSLVEPCLGSAYMIAFTSPHEKHQIRTHKGMFGNRKQLLKADYGEREMDLGKESYFIGVVKISHSNRDETIAVKHKPFGWSLLFSENTDLSQLLKELAETVPSCVNAAGEYPFLQWDRLSVGIVRDSRALLRVCGNDSKGYVGLKLLATKQECPAWLEKVQRFSSTVIPEFSIRWNA